ncbi:MAG: hypothetical protein PVI91_00270 [Gammaproteobacteria bacterium]|jgi:hypothetical protein
MEELSEEEQKRIMQSLPKGTFAVMLIYGLIMTLAWLALYFGRFLAHGPVS